MLPCTPPSPLQRRRSTVESDDEDWDLDEAYESDGAEGLGLGCRRSAFRLGEQDEAFHDYSGLALKPDHHNRCAGCCRVGRGWGFEGVGLESAREG